MKILIKNTPLPKNQIGKYIPKFPPGYLQAMQMTGWNPSMTPFTFPQSMISNVNITPINIPLDGLVNESTVDRPPSDVFPYDFIGPELEGQERELDPVTKAAWEQAQRDAAIIGTRDTDDGEVRYSAEDLMKMRQPKTTITTTISPQNISGPTLAAILTAGLSGLGNMLQKNNLQQASRRFQIRSGMTDSYFPVVPNLTSRGTTEINTGEMFPNLRVPVQFPGNPYASINRQPYFGMAQEGALIPKVPYDVPSISIPTTPSFNYTMGTDVYSDREEASSIYPSTESSSVNIVNSDTNAEISFTHNNPLNIHYGDFARKYGGTKGHPDSDGNVAIFQNIDTGITAARDLLFGPTYRNLTISQARKRWVGGPSNSISNIVKVMGGDKLLSSMTVEEREKLIKEFARWEGKQAYNLLKDMNLKPYLNDEYREGGEYDLTDDEIDYILANGGEIEYL